MKNTAYGFGCLLAVFAAACGDPGGAGESGELDTLREPLTSYTISGRVLTSTGVGIAGITVSLSGKATKSATTDASGNYKFTGLVAGSYTVKASYTKCSFSPTSKTVTLSANTTINFTGSGTGCESLQFNKKVYSLIFNPNITVNGVTKTLSQYEGWQDPATLATQYRDWLKATNSRVNYTISTTKVVNAWPTKEDAFVYNQTSYLACMANKATCHMPDASDYLKILNDYQLCQAVNAGTIDEVWMFGGPYFGFAESRLAGPNGYWLNSDPVVGSACGKLLPVMGFNYERPYELMVHDLGHRTESVMGRVYGGWTENSLANNFNKFGLVRVQSPSYGYSGCASIHYTPTATGTSDAETYIYNNQGPNGSFCDDFLTYPDLPASPVVKSTGCSAWGCTEIGYYQWWFQHLPKVPGFGADRKFADWWRYVIDPNQVFLTDFATCSSEYMGGWCQGVSDGTHGTCNAGEWATAGVSTGWVQVSFPAKKVSSVTLYDRACPEQVLSGRVQLSDNTTLTFGALEDTGATATKLTFTSRTLSWVKVYIDSSSGGNPGIGEIVVQ
jgi:hypothetical protein